MIEIGRPGAHASTLARTAGVRCVGASLIVVGLGLWLVGGSAPLVPVMVGLIAAGIAANSFAGDYQRAAVGVRSERRVAKVLRRSGAGAVIHGADLGSGGDADHVIVGPCLAVVETKTGTGRVEVRGDTFRVGHKSLPRNPISQARRQAALVRGATGIWCDTIVCIADAHGHAPFRIGDTIVCSVTTLPAALAMLPDRVSNHDLGRVVAQLR